MGVGVAVLVAFGEVMTVVVVEETVARAGRVEAEKSEAPVAATAAMREARVVEAVAAGRCRCTLLQFSPTGCRIVSR